MNESEEKFRKISDAANDAIIMADNEGNITYWNNAAEKMFDYSTEDVIGKQLHTTIIPDRFREAHLKGFNKYCDTGQGAVIGKTLELAAIKKDGTEIPIELSLSAVKIKDKWNAVGMIRDITERKRLEEELIISQKMSSVGRLSASVFHEILNPVNIISAHTQLLLMEAEKSSKTEEDLKSIQGEIDRIVDITDNLFKFAKKEGTKAEEVEINGLLENILSLIKSELNIKSIKPVTKFEKELPGVMTHGGELRQVFLNLITNAIDAMPDGGTLTVETRVVRSREFGVKSSEREVGSKTESDSGLRTPDSKLKGDFVEISFEDTGCGIAEGDIDKVFEPFFSTKKEIKGVGLGLSTSYAIIEGYGGKMSVECEEGKGTTVTVDLPVKDL